MKPEESGKRKRVATKAFVPAESQKRMRTSKRDKKGKAHYKDKNESSDEEEDYEVEFIVEDRFIRGKRQFKVRWLNYGPKDDSWVDEADMSCPKLVTDYERRKQEEQDEEEEEPDYEVEECLDYRTTRKGTREFLIKWKGYSSRSNTWEPEANLECPHLIKKCLEKKGGSSSPKKKATPKKTPKKAPAKRGRKPAAKNGKKADEDEEEDAVKDEEEVETAKADSDNEIDGRHDDEAEKDEFNDDNKDEEKVESEKPYKPGPKSRKKK